MSTNRKIKTCELTGAAIDWAVGIAQGWTVYPTDSVEHGDTFHCSPEKAPFGPTIPAVSYRPSTLWGQGGPIIEREEIGIKRRAPCMPGEEWEAFGSITAKGAGYRHAIGRTPLIAAMRCFVASKLGDEFEVPGDLCDGH